MKSRVSSWLESCLAPAVWLTAGILLFFTARRWLFLLAAMWPTRPVEPGPALSHVLLLVPFRNEVRSLPDLLLALGKMDYPADNLTVVLIDDGSTDGSQTLGQAWAERKPKWHVLSLARSQGKANALNAALAAFPQGEVVAVYDADERPRPEALRRLARHFVDPEVGGVSGRRAVANALASPAAGYVALEGLVHQFVTMRAKDRLNLAPALLGSNCAYRRSALARVGNFQPGALLEDSDLTVKLARAGFRTRFEPGAISYHQVPETIPGYWRQHTRWARGFNQVAGSHGAAVMADRRLSLPMRLELVAFSLGYLDRPALLAGVGLALLVKKYRSILLRLAGLSLATPLLQAAAALKLGQAPPALWARLAWLPLFFVIDAAMATTGLWRSLRRMPQVWEERETRR